jgi:hypothetical protein
VATTGRSDGPAFETVPARHHRLGPLARTVVARRRRTWARKIGTPRHLGVTRAVPAGSGRDLAGAGTRCGGARGRAGRPVSRRGLVVAGTATVAPSPYWTWAEHRAGRRGCHRAKRGEGKRSDLDRPVAGATIIQVQGEGAPARRCAAGEQLAIGSLALGMAPYAGIFWMRRRPGHPQMARRAGKSGCIARCPSGVGRRGAL